MSQPTKPQPAEDVGRVSIIVRLDVATRNKLMLVAQGQSRTVNKQIEHYIIKGIEKGL